MFLKRHRPYRACALLAPAVLVAAGCGGDPVRLSGFSAESAARQVTLERRLTDAPKATRIGEHHTALAVESEAQSDSLSIEYMAKAFTAAGFDSIEVHRYDIVLADSTTRPTVAVIGLLLGEEQPDQWVMAGGTRVPQAGRSDPMVGAASLLESARIIGRHARRRLRPRRTIALASWGAAGSGLEWRRAFGRMMTDKVIVYLHRDGYDQGQFRASGSHALQPLINDIARRVDAPGSEESIYAQWRRGAPVVNHGGWTDVRLDPLQSIPDHGLYVGHLGVPSVGFEFDSDSAQGADPNFETGEQLAEMVALFLTRMANAEVPPLDYTATTEMLERYFDQLESEAREHRVRLRLGSLRETVASLGFNAAAANAAADALLSIPDEDRDEVTALIEELAELLVDVEAGFLAPDTVGPGPAMQHQLYGSASETIVVAGIPATLRRAVYARDPVAAAAAVEQLESSLQVLIERFRIFLDKARLITADNAALG